AYTIGQDIVFGAGQFAPGTDQGRRLIAHELTHTLQQGLWPQRDAGSGVMIMGRWDSGGTDCSGVVKGRWIQTVVVNQETPQTVTLQWSDGDTESDSCSTGKGHCCVDSANPSGVACTVAGSHVDGSNCTPITQRMGFPVKNRVRDHQGVEFWSEFV